MKNHFSVVALFAAVCIFTACSKSSSDDNTGGPLVDSSKCLLANVSYESKPDMPYYHDPVTIYYDSLKRISSRVFSSAYDKYTYEPGKITKRSYINNTADSNLVNIVVYTLNSNNQVVSHTNAFYLKPKSESDFWRKDRMDYEYDADGYLTGTKLYAAGTYIYRDDKYTYQNGNLVQRINTLYGWPINPGVKLGADTLTYTYDNTNWLPEAAYLLEVSDFKDIVTGKPNKNNITGIQCKMYDPSTIGLNMYKTIQYTYLMKGPRTEKVLVAATTTKGYSISSTISFLYKCD